MTVRPRSRVCSQRSLSPIASVRSRASLSARLFVPLPLRRARPLVGDADLDMACQAGGGEHGWKVEGRTYTLSPHPDSLQARQAAKDRHGTLQIPNG